MSDSGRERRKCCKYCGKFHYETHEDIEGCRETLTDDAAKLRSRNIELEAIIETLRADNAEMGR